jgi:hypothetical protein
MHIFILEIFKSPPIFMHRSICHLSIIKQSIYMRILLQDMIIHQYIQKMSYLSPPWHHQKNNNYIQLSPNITQHFKQPKLNKKYISPFWFLPHHIIFFSYLA